MAGTMLLVVVEVFLEFFLVSMESGLDGRNNSPTPTPREHVR